MISAGEFRNGVTFEQDGQVLQVVEFQHVKPGKGAAFVRTKTKNVITGSVVETSYNPTAKFPQAFIERKDVTYSYEDGDLYHFMEENPLRHCCAMPPPPKGGGLPPRDDEGVLLCRVYGGLLLAVCAGRGAGLRVDVLVQQYLTLFGVELRYRHNRRFVRVFSLHV